MLVRRLLTLLIVPNGPVHVLALAALALCASCVAQVDVAAVEEADLDEAFYDEGETPDAPEPVAVCGDGACTGDEACEVCASDCGACADDEDGTDTMCGDGTCDESETCDGCAEDCGMCVSSECPTCLLSSAEAPDRAAACDRPAYSGGRSCRGVRGAYRASAVNVAFYPFRAVRDTAIYSGDPDPSHPGRRRLLVLRRGQGIDVQSTRNPGCSDSPPLRPSVGGMVFGVKHAMPNVGLTGWVRASDLEFVGYRPGRNCASGPAGADFQVRRNPYDECRPTTCENNPSSDDQRHCVPNNARTEGSEDCANARLVRLLRAVDAGTLHMRYSPGGTSARYLHRGDLVRVRLRITRRGTRWDFVQVVRSSSPTTTPVGSRGWVLSRWLEEPPAGEER